jgi:hypothetical protein
LRANLGGTYKYLHIRLRVNPLSAIGMLTKEYLAKLIGNL